MLPFRCSVFAPVRCTGRRVAWLFTVSLYFVAVAWAGPARNEKQRSTPLTVFIAGDVMLGRGVAPFLRDDARHTSLARWRFLITRSDIAFCNFECVLSPHSRATLTRLVADPVAASSLGAAGFDVVSTANNHALDAGSGGVRFTANALESCGVATVGSQWDKSGVPVWPAHERTIRGRRIAFVAASAWGPFMRGQARVRPLAGSGLIEQVRHLSAHALVFVSLHWGIENSLKPTTAQRQLAHRLIDAGAMAVIGHHPHVVQEVETYRGRPIFYSLGNFLFDRMPVPQSGLAAVLSIDGASCIQVASFAVQPVPQADKDNVKAVLSGEKLVAALHAIARWLLPRNERVKKVVGARLLPGSQSSQLLVWSQAPKGHRLRAYGKTGDRWKLLAQGRHADIFDVQCGRVINESKSGAVQLVLGLRQRSKLDVKVQNRLHVYDLNPRGGFRPLWRGSALSRPFHAYTLLPDAEGRCDLVAVEKNPLPNYREFEWITVYRWNDFGFRALWDTPVRGMVVNLRIEIEPEPPRHVIRFEQRQKNSVRTLTLRRYDDGSSQDTTFKASVEP